MEQKFKSIYSVFIRDQCLGMGIGVLLEEEQTWNGRTEDDCLKMHQDNLSLYTRLACCVPLRHKISR